MEQIWSYRVPVWVIGASLLLACAVFASIVLLRAHLHIDPALIVWPIAAIGAVAASAWGAIQLINGKQTRVKSDKLTRRDQLLDAELAKVLAVIKSRLAHDESYAQRLNDVQRQLEMRPSGDELAAIIDTIIVENQKAKQSAADAIRELNNAHVKIAKLQRSLDEAVAETLKDPLTGVENRRSFDLALSKAIATAEASDKSMTLVMCDLDHFKKINDEFGHAIGDQVLKLAAQALSTTVRDSDIVCRVGGEEFAIILPNTSLKEALTVSERMRAKLLSQTLAVRGTNKTIGRISASFGVAERYKGDDAARLIDRSDGALYRAKALGRNCVVS